MIPVEITANMMEPVCFYGDGLHIDGPLAYACFMDLPIDERAAIPPITTGFAIDFDLPLAKWQCKAPNDPWMDLRLLDEDDMLWGWAASAAHADWKYTGAYAVRRRPDHAMMQKFTCAPSLNIGAGHQKATSLRYPEQWASRILWYAVGDVNEIERLLNTYVPAIGKLHNKGPGRVLRWSVREIDDDFSIMRNGRLSRIMPFGGRWIKLGVAAGSLGIRPPYHHKSRRVDAVIPEYDELRP